MQRRFIIDNRLQTSALGRSWLEELKVTFCMQWFVLARMSCRWRPSLTRVDMTSVPDVGICVAFWLEKLTIYAVRLTLCSDGAAACIDEMEARVAASRLRCFQLRFLSSASIRVFQLIAGYSYLQALN